MRIIAMPSPDISLRFIAPAMQVGGALCLSVAVPFAAFPPLCSSGLCPCHSMPFNAFADQGAPLHIHSCDLRNFAAAGQRCAGPRRFVSVLNHAAAILCGTLPLRSLSFRCRCVATLSISVAILNCAMQCLCYTLPHTAPPCRCRSVHYSSAPWRFRAMHYRAVPLLCQTERCFTKPPPCVATHRLAQAVHNLALPLPFIASQLLCDACLRLSTALLCFAPR